MDGIRRGLLKIKLVLLNKNLSVLYINIRFVPHREYSVLPLEGTIVECCIEKKVFFLRIVWNTKIQYAGKLRTIFCIEVASTYNTMQ